MPTNPIATWPLDLGIEDAGDEVKVQTIVVSYTDPANGARTGSATLTRTPMQREYFQGHPDHIPIPVNTFVAFRVNKPGSIESIAYLYGGRLVTLDAIFVDFILTGYTATPAGRNGPDLPGAQGIVDLYVDLEMPTVLVDGDVVTFSGGGGTSIVSPFHVLDKPQRLGVVWNGRLDDDGNPATVPISAGTLLRFGKLRKVLPGTNAVSVLKQYKVLGARCDAMSRLLTFTGITDEDDADVAANVTPGMYLSLAGSSDRFAAVAQVAEVIDPQTIRMSAHMRQLGNNSPAWVESLELAGVTIQDPQGRIVQCDDTTGILRGMQFRWLETGDNVGEVEEVIDATTFRLLKPPLFWEGPLYVFDGDLEDDAFGFHDAVDIGDDSDFYTPAPGTEDGFTVTFLE